jgi:hypothetical protein
MKIRLGFLLSATSLLAGCADHVSLVEAALKPRVGFWFGLWHGAILPFAFAFSLFDHEVAIYAIYNNGAWYDFGYVVGVLCVWGGGAAASRRT